MTEQAGGEGLRELAQAEALFERGNYAGARVVSERLRGSPDPEIRAGAERLLARMGVDNVAVTVLVIAASAFVLTVLRFYL